MTYYPNCKTLVHIFFHTSIKIKKKPAPSSGLKITSFQTVKNNSSQDFLTRAVLKSPLLSYLHSSTRNFKKHSISLEWDREERQHRVRKGNELIHDLEISYSACCTEHLFYISFSSSVLFRPNVIQNRHAKATYNGITIHSGTIKCSPIETYTRENNVI